MIPTLVQIGEAAVAVERSRQRCLRLGGDGWISGDDAAQWWSEAEAELLTLEDVLRSLIAQWEEADDPGVTGRIRS